MLQNLLVGGQECPVQQPAIVWPLPAAQGTGWPSAKSQRQECIQDSTLPCCCMHSPETLLKGEARWFAGGGMGCDPGSVHQRSSHPPQGTKNGHSGWECPQIRFHPELACLSECHGNFARVAQQSAETENLRKTRPQEAQEDQGGLEQCKLLAQNA